MTPTESGTTPVATAPLADCTVDTDGRISFVIRDAADGTEGTDGEAPLPRLLLRTRPKKGQDEPETEPLEHVLDLKPAAEDPTGALRAVLEPDLRLAEGRWDVCLLPGPGQERRRLRPGLRDLRDLVGGHSRDWPSPVAVRIPYVTKDGHLAVRSWLRTAHAEVERVDLTPRSMTVRARLHGASLGEGAVVRLRPRGGTGAARTVRPQAGTDGRDFSFTVSYEELGAAGRTGTRIWDIHLRTEGAPPVRLARLLDDIPNRKEIIVYPTEVVDGTAVRPFYTVDNELSVKTSRSRARGAGGS